ncbi:MAG: type II toxin-antitoxin system VapC family toxin [Xanthobacteraceae bacterium]
MKWLLDTNVLSESIRPDPNRKVLAWIAAHPGEELAISLMTVAELRAGVAALGGASRQRSFDAWLRAYVVPNFGERTLPVTLEILVDWIQLSRQLNARGRPKAAADLLIASTARTHDLTLVTRNFRDFADTGVVVYDPWTGNTRVMDPA